MSVVSVQELHYRYRIRQEPALRGCTFHAEPGNVLLIAGASGSGKTTLMRCLNGLIPRSYTGGELRGRIRLAGQDPSPLSLAQISRLVGTVLQDPEKQIIGAYVLNDVAFGLENLAVPRDEMRRRIDHVLDLLGLRHLRDRPTTELSGGEKQKVAIAGVLAMEPEILLLDEPLASLDPASCQETLALIRGLADMGKAVLLIEHRVEDVLAIDPTHALFLEGGCQRYFGPLEGFLQVADPQEVKLPAPHALAILAQQAPQPGPPSRSRQPHLPPLAALERVSFGYIRGRPVLHQLSLAIHPGDVVAILGPNGAGKSTLLRHLIGLLHPDEGRVIVAGRDTREMSVAEIAHHVGYVFQSPTHMLFAPTVREEVAFGPRNLGFPPDRVEANVRRALQVVDLEAHVDSSPLALSFGQQRRVGIAAILAMEPKLLLMDEPTAGQDYRHYTEFMDAIVQMPFDAVAFITHDVDLAVRYANRVVLLVDGQVVADGPPEQVLGDDALLSRCRLRPTSLLELNRRLLPETGRFLPLETLAHHPRVQMWLASWSTSFPSSDIH